MIFVVEFERRGKISIKVILPYLSARRRWPNFVPAVHLPVEGNYSEVDYNPVRRNGSLPSVESSC